MTHPDPEQGKMTLEDAFRAQGSVEGKFEVMEKLGMGEVEAYWRGIGFIEGHAAGEKAMRERAIAVCQHHAIGPIAGFTANSQGMKESVEKARHEMKQGYREQLNRLEKELAAERAKVASLTLEMMEQEQRISDHNHLCHLEQVQPVIEAAKLAVSNFPIFWDTFVKLKEALTHYDQATARKEIPSHGRKGKKK